ncbi:MAG TPA: membrane dipeptidase [Xanthomonadaceae bacterium]|nr:membrane dipeptidase [Xanthomonadaceae bacterium]
MDRRDFLAAGAAFAAGALFDPAAPAAPRAWPPFAGMLAIDGASGTNLVYFDQGDPAIAGELAAARACGLAATLLTVGPQGRFWLDDAAFERTRANIAKWRATIDAHPDTLMLVQTGADLARAHRARKLGQIFGFQGTEPLGEDLERIPMFRKLGVRVIQLTHNRRNLVGDGSMEPGNAGLSRFGHEVVERLNAEKIVVDLAHGSQRTMREGILASKAPPLISHTGCRALSDLPRCTSDEELRLLADRGGVAGMIFWPYLRRDTQPMAIDLVRHIEHAIDVCGEDHVGLGSDTPVAPVERTPQFEKENRENIADMVEQGVFERGRPQDLYLFIPDLNRADRYEVLAGMLARRGHSEARIAKVMGGNFARVMAEVWG